MLAPLAALALLATSAAPGSEVVLVLDTSCSMAQGFSDQSGRQLPANDPQRTAVLGAALVQGLAQGSEDRVTVIGFAHAAEEQPPIAANADELRAFRYTSGTFFKRPLQEARQLLEQSPRQHRLFLFFTDGAPDDLDDPAQGPELLGLPGAPFDTLIIGLYGSPESRQVGQSFLTPLAKAPEDLVFVTRPAEVVTAFTRGYARALGARPETGTLAPGGTRPIPVGKYVTEVLVTLAQSEPGEAFHATLTGPNGPVAVQSQGDNGCPPSVSPRGMPRLCAPPRRHYMTFRAPNNPEAAGTWSLALPQSPGSVDYGVILRYDLAASLTLPPNARAGEPVPVEAQLLFRGKPVDDAPLFASDGFEASARIGADTVKLQHAGGGRFTGTWVPASAGTVGAEVTFRNTWMEKRARASLSVEGQLEVKLIANPTPVELGAWRGERGGTRRCAELDLSQSTNADRVELRCQGVGAPEGSALTCEPVPGSEAVLPGGQKGQPLRYQVCAGARGCCDELVSTGSTLVRLLPTTQRYADRAADVPVRYHVESTGFLRCWWWLLALIAGVLFALWFIAGWVRPYNFDPAGGVRVSGSEAGLKRASALVLRELPGGVRGFYRNARICLNASGDFVRNPRMAVLVVEAGPASTTKFVRGAGLERKNRNGQWEPVPQGEWPQGPAPNLVYRLGGLHVRFS